MMNTIRLVLNAAWLLVVAILLASCGNTETYSSIEPGTETARSRANLELPPDLQTSSSDALAATQAEQQTRSEEVLPEPEGMAVTRNDEEGWIEVDAPPDRVWRKLVAHWGALGVDLVVSNPEEGIMETDWVEPTQSNKAEPGLTDKVIGQFLGRLFDEVTALDKYTLMLQRTDQDGTRIDVTHRGIKKIQTQRTTVATNAEWDWVETEEDPDKIRRALSSITYGLANGTS